MRNMKGFSLIELLVVVAIIGVLAAAGVVGYQNYTQTAKENVAKNNFGNVVRYVRTQSGIAATGVSTSNGACNATDFNFAKCDSASAAAAIMDEYFREQGFTNPMDSDEDAVVGFASSPVASDCTGSTDNSGLIAVYASGASDANVYIVGCDEFGTGATLNEVTNIKWAD